METLLITIHYSLCAFLILIILLQAGKGADIGAVFGGASQTVFGGRGPTTFLNRITVFVAVGFLVTSIWLAHLSKTRSVETVFDKATTSAPAAPVPATTPAEGTTEEATPATEVATPAKPAETTEKPAPAK